ncbi:MAG: hypothetical protein M0005_02585 [Actinomycetota bacterium]|jgi:hypothetical protein|nr:hypothetical protein [Actinomycetota bacterium]
MAADVVCPTCNTVSHLDEVERDANCFCRTCDYPLFWAKRTSLAPAPSGQAGGGTNGNGSRRRLPGAEGWAVTEQVTCPECCEPNLLTESFCVRCGADLHPRPPAPAYVAPPPVPRPVPVPPEPAPARRRRWWPWVTAACLPFIGLVTWILVTYA